MRRALPLALAVLSLLSLGVAATQARGSLAYVKDSYAWVEASEGGRAVRLAQSVGAWAVALNPKDGSAAYSIALEPPDPQSGTPPKQRVYFSRPPYASAIPLPKPLDAAAIRVLAWGDDGRALAAYGDDGLIAAYDTVTKRNDANYAPYGALSRDGSVAARANERGIEIVGPGARPERWLVTTGAPAPLFNALRAQASNQDVRDLLDSTTPDLYSNRWNWVLSDPALSPDGEALYFATNAGSGMGAAGNATFVIVKADTATGRLLVLGKLGSFFGRSPQIQVSPDGRKLLVSTSVHSSAVENPAVAYAIDLVSQKSVELLRNTPATRDLASLSAGQCWLADSRTVALSVAYYKVPDSLDDPSALPDPKFDLLLKDATSGRLLRRIPGATSPSCGPVLP